MPPGFWPATPICESSKKRLGHGTITTTEQYLHTLGGADDTALSALHSIRRPTTNT